MDLGKFKVSPFITTKIGFAEMSLPSYLDSSLTLNKIPKNQTGINFNTGFSLELPFMYLGFQANNLYALADNSNRQNSYFGPVSYRIVAGTDYRKFITTDVLVSPQIYTDIINGRVENNFALTSRYKGFLSGASYSTTNDAKLMVGMDVKRLRVGYSVSANTTNFDVISHEVGIQYIFSKRSSGYLVY